MAEQYLTHITRDGERWDQLAFIYYGDALRYEPIIRANQHVPISTTLQAGLKLRIPLLDVKATTEDLPPWLR